MVTQNDNSTRRVEVGALLSPEETRKLWKEYQAGTLDKWMYGDLPLGWSQVVSKAQAVLTLTEVGKWMQDFLRKHSQFDIATMETLVDSDLICDFRDALLIGKLPDSGSPTAPPPSEAIKP
jgi:hypothetical protein